MWFVNLLITAFILFAVIKLSKFVLAYLPARFLKVPKDNHSKVDKLAAWVIGIFGFLPIFLIVEDFRNPNKDFWHTMNSYIIPCIILLATVYVIACILILAESYFTDRIYVNKYGMKKQAYNNMMIEKANNFSLELNNKYGYPSNTIEFIDSSSDQKGNQVSGFIYDKHQLLIIASNISVIMALPFTSILHIQPQSETTQKKRATARTTTTTGFWGMGKTFFGGSSTGRSKTVFYEAVYETRYYIDVTLNSFKYPSYRMFFGLNKSAFENALHLLRIIMEQKNNAEIGNDSIANTDTNFSSPLLAENL